MEEHLQDSGKVFSSILKIYENIPLMGDYNGEITEANMSSFCEICTLTVYHIDQHSI